MVNDLDRRSTDRETPEGVQTQRLGAAGRAGASGAVHRPPATGGLDLWGSVIPTLSATVD